MRRRILVALAFTAAFWAGYERGKTHLARELEPWIKAEARRLYAESVTLKPCQDPIVYLAQLRKED